MVISIDEEMMFRKNIPITICFAVFAFVFWTYPVSASKTYHAERFDVHIEVQPDGQLMVTEKIAFHFEGGPFTYVFRDLAFANLDDIEIQEASMDGKILPEGYDAGQIEIDNSRPLKVTWHFSSTSDSTHTFELVYKVSGVIRKLDSDKLVWRAIPGEHAYPIDRSEISLTFPDSTRLVNPPTLNRAFNQRISGNTVRMMTGGLGEDVDVVLTANLSAGSLILSPPNWQLRQEQERTALTGALPMGLLSLIVSLVLGGMCLWLYANANRRERLDNPATPYTIPPQDIPPALVGKLLGYGNPILGTLFDFARRDILEIQETAGQRLPSVIRKPHSESLRPHEQILLNGLFPEIGETVELGEIGMRIVPQLKNYDRSLEEDLSQMGWFDTARKKQRSLLMAFWASLLFIAVALCFTLPIVALYLFGKEPIAYTIAAISIGLCSGISIVSIAGLFYAANFSVLTPLGDEQALRWKSFQGYLQKVGQGIEPLTHPDLFDRYLPFSAVFGFGEGWIKNCQKMGLFTIPAWLHSQTSDSGFSTLSSMISTLDTSSSSASGDGGGASGGASGGGASGAG